MPDVITALCQFYADQYGMTFDTIYDPVFFVLKGRIVFHNTTKKFAIMCEGRTGKEIAGSLHSIIFDILAEEGRC